MATPVRTKYEPPFDPHIDPTRAVMAARLARLDLVNLDEIATRLQVKPGTTGAWRTRGRLPAPDLPGHEPRWFWWTIAEWCARTGYPQPRPGFPGGNPYVPPAPVVPEMVRLDRGNAAEVAEWADASLVVVGIERGAGEDYEYAALGQWVTVGWLRRRCGTLLPCPAHTPAVHVRPAGVVSETRGGVTWTDLSQRPAAHRRGPDAPAAYDPMGVANPASPLNPIYHTPYTPPSDCGGTSYDPGSSSGGCDSGGGGGS